MKPNQWLLLAVTLTGVAWAGGPVEAAVVRSGEVVSVPAGQTIADDFYAFGRDVVIDGTVQGDVIAMGNHVTVNGRVKGNVIAAGREVRMPSGSGESMRVLAQHLVLGGAVGRDLLALAGEVKTEPNLIVQGQSYMTGRTLSLVGDYGHSLSAKGREIHFAGVAGGPVTLEGEQVNVSSNARAAGVMTVSSANAHPVAAGATADEIRVTQLPAGPAHWGGAVAGWILALGMALVLGLVLVWLLPESAERSSRLAMQSPGGRMLWGVVAFVVVPIIGVIAMMTLVGLPLGVLVLALYALALYLSQLVVGEAVGKTILAQRRPVNSTGARCAALALGLVILYALMAIPYVGSFIGFVVTIWGLGTLMAMLKQNLRRQYEEVPT